MLPEFLYHVTARENLPSIQREGLRPGAYLSSLKSLCDYYAETIEDEGKVPFKIRIPTKNLKLTAFEPDHAGLEEPIISVVRSHLGAGYECNEEWVYEKWLESNQDYEACLALVGSVRYAAAIPAAYLDLGRRNPRITQEGTELGF